MNQNEVLFTPDIRADDAMIEAQRQKITRSSMFPVIDELPIQLVVLNSKRQLVFYNQQAGTVFKKKESVLGKRLGEALDCVHSCDSPEGCGFGRLCRYCGAARNQAAALNASYGSEECVIIRKNDGRTEQLDLMVWSRPLLLEGEEFILFYMNDMTARKRHAIIERIFLHDILNTIASVSSLLALAREEGLPSYFDLAQEAADLAVEEIQAHRWLKDAEYGDLRPNVNRENLKALVEAVIAPQKKIASSRGITMETRVENQAFYTDSVLLKRVLHNLVKNAIEASSAGDIVRVRALVQSESEEEKRYVGISISNPSVIDDEKMAHMFKRSFSTKGRDRGLGTYAARLFVEDVLGGQIKAESGEGMGTVFTVLLPI